MNEAELIGRVDAVFVDTAADLKPWPDPHGFESPDVEEYSRVSNPERWRIVGSGAPWMPSLRQR